MRNAENENRDDLLKKLEARGGVYAQAAVILRHRFNEMSAQSIVKTLNEEAGPDMETIDTNEVYRIEGDGMKALGAIAAGEDYYIPVRIRLPGHFKARRVAALVDLHGDQLSSRLEVLAGTRAEHNENWGERLAKLVRMACDGKSPEEISEAVGVKEFYLKHLFEEAERALKELKETGDITLPQWGGQNRKQRDE